MEETSSLSNSMRLLETACALVLALASAPMISSYRPTTEIEKIYTSRLEHCNNATGMWKEFWREAGDAPHNDGKVYTLNKMMRIYTNPGPNTFAAATVLFGSMLFILAQNTRPRPLQDSFLIVAIALGVVMGVFCSEEKFEVIPVLMKYTPWTLLGGQLLNLAMNKRPACPADLDLSVDEGHVLEKPATIQTST